MKLPSLDFNSPGLDSEVTIRNFNGNGIQTISAAAVAGIYQPEIDEARNHDREPRETSKKKPKIKQLIVQPLNFNKNARRYAV